MADGSLDIIEPLDYHPCDTPRGCTYYDRKFLSNCQQLKLNQLKLATIKSAERYLRTNPEIRGFVALITRHVFRQQPRRDVPKAIAEYFRRPRAAIEEELEEYLRTRPPPEPEELCLDEETVYAPEDFDRYLAAMQPCAEEETSDARQASTPEDPSVFIRAMLLERVAELPCFEPADKMHRRHTHHHEHVHDERRSHDDEKLRRTLSMLNDDVPRRRTRKGVSILEVSGSERSMMRKLLLDLKQRSLDSKHDIATDDGDVVKGKTSGTRDGPEEEESSPDKAVQMEVEQYEEPVGTDATETVQTGERKEEEEEEEEKDEHKVIVEEGRAVGQDNGEQEGEY